MVIFEVCGYQFDFKEGNRPLADQLQEYIEYLEDLSASSGLKFEPHAEIGKKSAVM